MELLILFPAILILPFIVFYIYPVKFVQNLEASDIVLEPPKFYLYSYVFHIHTQFSYDSLGKPEDVFRARDEEKINFVIITDHEVDFFKFFEDEKTIVGVEKKINDSQGKLLGDLIEVGDIKVISHHFKKKYRWRLERNEEYIFELINLKDALVENRKNLFFYLFLGIFLYPFAKKSYIKNFVKTINLEKYIRNYLKEGWKNKIIGGLDHHVKVYIREVGIRFLFPSYKFSFSLLRNFLISKRPLKDKKDFLNAIKREKNVISFSNKPTLFWLEESTLYVYSPFPRTLIRVFSKNNVRSFHGSNLKLKLSKGTYLVCGYTYAFRIGRFFFGLKPLFLSDLIKIN